MGSWDETCAISKQSIAYGEKVKLALLLQNPYRYEPITGLYKNDTKTYANPKEIEAQQAEYDKLPVAFKGQNASDSADFWCQAALPLNGTYDSYGSINLDENPSNNVLIELFLKVLTEKVIPLHVGANPYHDSEVELPLKIESVLDALERGRLFHLASKNRYVPFGACFIKESVWNGLCALDFPANTFWSQPPTLESYLSMSLTDWSRHILSSRGYYSYYESLENIDIETFKQIRKPLAEYTYIQHWLHLLRNPLAPTTGSGSQSVNHHVWKKAYRLFSQVATQSIKESKL
jgi:hypothetical protein